MPKKVRAINHGRGSSVAKARQELYRQCAGRVRLCMNQHFYLEAIALIESMIADRLESRLAALNLDNPKHRIVGTIGDAFRANHKFGRVGLLNQETDPLLLESYERVRKWAKGRNECLHEMVKFTEGDSRSWPEKYETARSVAKEGWSCFRELDSLGRKANRALKLARKVSILDSTADTQEVPQ
jgi:hypothetical protein